MEFLDYLEIFIAILTGIATAIPLIVKLVNTVKDATMTKNWNLLIKLTMDYMTQAESNFKTGAERKEWVMSMVKVSAANINYDLTDEDIGKLEDLIDAICDASKILNNAAEKDAALKAAQEVAANK